ncbi:hypothetical protein [Fibrobacter sp. UWB10]|uniref:hypothetical protein n=1 Tax=Fibrobacter sp. UWB10 TaxID=1896201 RepID=UPI0024030A3F|nr:hypothetical protein [Fibrobacter sp. UWB10]SMP52258.1 hypothetical protein SAMN05720465_2064 [Fibrobacter sp. UWB10]
MAEKVRMVITLDSDSDSSTTDQREEILARHGFFKLTPEKKIRLPESTYIGLVSSTEAGKKKVDAIWKELEDFGLEPRRIFGANIGEWQVYRSEKDKD